MNCLAVVIWCNRWAVEEIAEHWLIVEVHPAVQQQCCVHCCWQAMHELCAGWLAFKYVGWKIRLFDALLLTIEASLTILTPFDSVVTSVGGGSFGACRPSTDSTPGRGCVSGVLILLGPLGSHEGNVALLLSARWA
jgi:hypothetical protein